MILSISSHIYSKLAASTALTALVGDRIFPLGTKNEVAFPFVVYERDTINVDYDKACRRIADVDVTVYAVAETYTKSLEIAEIVADLLDKSDGSYTGFDVVDAIITGASEGFIENSYVQQISFQFKIEENHGS